MSGDLDTTTIAVQTGKLEAKLDSNSEKLDAIHRSLKEDIGKVEEQTRLTNGRVTTLEKRQAELRGIGIALVALSPFALFFFQWLTH
jgi:hypothetical protein